MGNNVREKYLQWKAVEGGLRSFISRPGTESHDTWWSECRCCSRSLGNSALPSACSVCRLPLLPPVTWPKPLLWTIKHQPCISVSVPFHTIDFFQAFFFSSLLYFFLTTYEIIDKRVQNHEHCNKTKH